MSDEVTSLAGFKFDQDYPVVQIPSPQPPQEGANAYAFSQPIEFADEPEQSTYLVRGEISEPEAYTAHAFRHPDIVGVFADPTIETTITCGGSPAVGTFADVAAQLAGAQLSSSGLDGAGVAVAVVDTGINLAWLKQQGRTPTLDASQSWNPKGVAAKPGNHPKNHGTMCAFDVGIAAPRASLLDYAVLLSHRRGATQMEGLLSDAVLAYSRLLRFTKAMPANYRSLVVTNSWGMFSPSSDFPVGNPGNYSDNPAHPFNVIVASLAAAGADILFAAGNCGVECPDARCAFNGTRPICGANSHPSVLCIAGIDIHRGRVGYSSQGPGRLSAHKPDISSYTHFTGSHVFDPEPDRGTSAACPVAAGLVAALRTKYPASQLSPAQLRSILFQTADDLGPPGFDYDFGWGAFNVPNLMATLANAGKAGPGGAS